MTTSAILINSLLREVDGRWMKMMIYGMGKDVAQAAVAVSGTTHLTSASTSTTPHLRTWNSDSSHIITTNPPLPSVITLPLCLS